jgi:PhnO protein
MEQSIKIRNASLKDVEVIFLYISHLEEMSFNFEDFKVRYAENIGNPDILYLVGVNENDKPLGFVSCYGQSLLHHEGKIFEIQEMYVAKNSRDLGIGRALYAALEERLKALECQILEVATHAKRTDAKKFYSKLGFEPTHVKFVKAL